MATPASSGPPNPKPRFPRPWPVSEPPPDTDGAGGTTVVPVPIPSATDRCAAPAPNWTVGGTTEVLPKPLIWRAAEAFPTCTAGGTIWFWRSPGPKPGPVLATSVAMVGGGATTLGAGMASLRILIGHLFGSRHRRWDHLHRIRSRQTKCGELALGHGCAGRDSADIHLRCRPHLLGHLRSWSDRRLGQCRSSLRRPHSFRRSGAGKRFHREQVGYRGIGFRQIKLRRVGYGFPQLCFRAPPVWFGWDDAPHGHRSGRNAPPRAPPTSSVRGSSLLE